jgi:Positive regulator of sigma E activity
MGKGIQHKGIIEKIEHHCIYVRIVQQSACAGCHVKSICPGVDSVTKIIEIEDDSGRFKLNEQVLICGHYSIGMQAVWLAFIVPLLLIVSVAVIGTILSGNEIIGGLLGLFMLLPYYIIIYLTQDKLKKKLVFTLSKISCNI